MLTSLALIFLVGLAMASVCQKIKLPRIILKYQRPKKSRAAGGCCAQNGTVYRNKIRNKKGIPQLILAGAFLDDVSVIVLISTFIGMAQGNSVNIVAFINIPVSITLGMHIYWGGCRISSVCFFLKPDMHIGIMYATA